MQTALSRLRVPAGILATVLAVSAGAPAWADVSAAQDVPAAVWAQKEKQYTFMGFTAHYSCDGLRDKMRSILLKLGARSDLQVTSTACPGGFGRPIPFPGVSIKMQVLTPATGTASDSKTVPAHWKMVDLTANRDPLDVAGDCELIEQVKQQILPLFTTRHVQYQSTCIPNQLSVGGTQLKAEVLVADQGKTPAQ